MMFLGGVFLIIVCFTWYACSCIKADQRDKEETKKLMSGKNFGEYAVILSSEDNGEPKFVKILRWEPLDQEGMAEVYSDYGPHPNGYTASYYWPRNDLQILR